MSFSTARSDVADCSLCLEGKGRPKGGKRQSLELEAGEREGRGEERGYITKCKRIIYYYCINYIYIYILKEKNIAN